MLEIQSFKLMAAILYYPMFLTRHRPSNVQIQRFKRPSIKSIPCWRYSHLNSWRLYNIILCYNRSQAIKRPNTAIQTSKYRVNPMLEAQSFKLMAAILYYPMFLTRHRPSNVQIQQAKRPNIRSITCWRCSHLNTWQLHYIIQCFNSS